MSKKIIEQFGIQLKGVDKDNSTLEAVFSTANQDRHGDIVHQNWDLKNFKANPVILNSHNYDDATEVVGRAEKVKIVDGKLQGKIKFAVRENPKAQVIFDLYAGGFLNAFSVGFMPQEFNDKGEIQKSELLEVSAVSVPANAYALAKKKGIDVEALKKEYEDEETPDGEPTESIDEVESPQEEAQPESDDSEGEPKETELEDEGSQEEDDGEDEGEEPGDGEDGDVPEGGESEPVEEEEVEEEEDEFADAEDPAKDEGPKHIEPQPEEVKALDVQDRQALAIEKIANVIGQFDREYNKVETRSESVRAKQIRLINKAIRNLTSIKKKV